MSEIKSTLDLVMERTKNLTLTAAEKERQQKADLKRQLTGLIQQFQDQAIKATEVQERLDELKQTFGPGIQKQMRAAIIESIDINADNNGHLTLLETYFQTEVTPFKQVLETYQQVLDGRKNDCSKRLREQLSAQYAISGSAVIPNIDADPQWSKERSTLADQFQAKLAVEKNRLAAL